MSGSIRKCAVLCGIEDNDLFLYDNNGRRIYHYDKSGQLLNILDKVGRGQQEYVSISEYAFSERDRLLYIYSYAEHLLKAYSVSDMSFYCEYPIEYDLSVFEFPKWNKNAMLAIFKDSKSGGGVASIDLETGEKTVLQSGSRSDSYGETDSYSLCPTRDGSLNACLPDYPNQIIELSYKGAKTVSNIVLENSVFDKQYWEGSYDMNNYTKYMMTALRHKERVWYPVYYARNRNNYSFWVLTGKDYYGIEYFMTLFLSGKSYKPLLPDGSDINPMGMTSSGEYVSLVSTEQIKDFLNEDIKSEQSLLFFSF